MAARNVIRCTLNIVSVLTLFVLYKLKDAVIYNYIYVAIVLGINYILALWYVISYREITFGKHNTLKEEKNEILYFFRVGIPLLLSNLIAQLIFVVDQQFVNIAFDNETYSVYAFAYNMIALITIATSAVSTVLYPTLKTINEESITRNYSKINSYLVIFVAFCLLAYYPLDLIIQYFLPSYAGSLPVFFIILPGVLFSSSISVIKYNCYKTFGKINNYFIKSIVILALAVIADAIVYSIFRDTKSISIVSIGVLFAWYVIVEQYFVKHYHVKWVKNLCYILLTITGYYLTALIPNIYLKAQAYFVYYMIATGRLYNKEIIDAIARLKT